MNWLFGGVQDLERGFGGRWSESDFGLSERNKKGMFPRIEKFCQALFYYWETGVIISAFP